MPRVLAARPRKMLPPPGTMPICSPSPCTSRISSASASITASSTPCSPPPARISPESLRRTRCQRRATALLLAEPEPREAPHHDVLPGLAGGLLDQVADLDLVVPDVGLLEQDHLGVELLELAVHDLV